MNMNSEQEVEMLARALSEFGRYVGEIQESQWNLPTPNDDWDVRALVQHMTSEVLWVPDLLAGKTIEQVGDKYDGDVLGDHPHAAWQAAADKALEATRSLQTLDGVVHVSYGDLPARTYLQHQLIDLTIHAWDLARAIGAHEKLDPELVHAVYDWFEPQAGDWRETGTMKPAVRVPEDSPQQVQLIALSGRNPASNQSPEGRL
jgi:uncharacterized protein (TIGR03086 family)